MKHPISPRVAVAVLLLTLGLVGSLSRPAAAAAADWSAAPADNHFGAGRTDFRYTLNPGGELEDGVAVTNSGAAPLDITLRADEGVPGMHLNAETLTVAAGETADVAFTVTLARDARPGDHFGGIVVAAHGSETTLPVNLRVGGPLEPSLAVEDVHVRREGGDAAVTYVVRNTGNQILSAHPKVSISGPFGRWAADAGKLADTPALLPGTTWQGTARVPGVTAAVRLSATVELLPLVTDAAGSVAPLSPVKTTAHALAIPWLLLGVLVAAGVLAGAGRKAVRRRKLVFSR